MNQACYIEFNNSKFDQVLTQSLNSRLETQHQSIWEITAEVPIKELNVRFNPEKWSISENIAHLGRYQEIFEDRLRRILDEPNPGFGRYRAEDDDLFPAWLKKNPDERKQSILLKRKDLINEIGQLDSGELLRRGRHPKLGMMTVTDWIDFFLLHEAHHIYTIFWLTKTSRA